MTLSRLTASALCKRYKKRTVVKDVSFEVGSGEVVGLLGPNGAGKTTCFYMVVGLVACDGGNIHIDGGDLTHMPIHRRARLGLSYLPQENSVFRKLSVANNVRAVLELQSLDAGQVEVRLAELLEELHITHCRAVSVAVSRLPAPSPPTRASSCSTNLLPASTRLPSSTFKR
jgi:lipopolysaccharide export system ATP-binding protein